jgi:dienelactone hydrolase
MSDHSPPTTTDDSTTAARTLRIDAPAESRVDERIDLRVRGASPGERVTLAATTTDADGHDWRSEAAFAADADGVVDLAECAPTDGSYDSVAPMGWCWSMTADADDALVTALMDGSPLTIRLTATAGDRTAERTITRTVVPADVSRTDVDRPDLRGTAFDPPGDGPHPGVLVLHGSSGRPALFRAGLLAAHGFATFAVHYAGEDVPVGDGIERVPLPYFDRAAEWFGDREAVADGDLGVLGHSWGTIAALLLGARREWVGAVVSYNGSGVVWDTPSGAPAWVDAEGDPLDCVSGQAKPTLCEGQLDDADPETVAAATIRVEDTDAPVLLVSGGEDPVWPARRLSEVAAERLREADHDAVEHLTYDDAGHFVTPPYLPKNHSAFGGTARGIATADADAWPTALASLRRGLEAPADDVAGGAE